MKKSKNSKKSPVKTTGTVMKNTAPKTSGAEHKLEEVSMEQLILCCRQMGPDKDARKIRIHCRIVPVKELLEDRVEEFLEYADAENWSNVILDEALNALGKLESELCNAMACFGAEATGMEYNVTELKRLLLFDKPLTDLEWFQREDVINRCHFSILEYRCLLTEFKKLSGEQEKWLVPLLTMHGHVEEATKGLSVLMNNLFEDYDERVEEFYSSKSSRAASKVKDGCV